MESVAVAKKRWDNLKKLELSSFCKEFDSFQNKMTEKLFESLSVFFYDQKFQTTSNSAERYARKIEKIQKIDIGLVHVKILVITYFLHRNQR